MTQARQPAHDPSQQITALYQAHALGLVRLAFVMTGRTAEDLVQDAFLGLHRRWDTLVDPGKALSYVRSCVLNGCREIHRVRHRRPDEHRGPRPYRHPGGRQPDPRRPPAGRPRAGPAPSPALDVTTLAIYSVSTGARLRAWTAPPRGRGGVSRPCSPDWPSGRQLVFSVSGATADAA